MGRGRDSGGRCRGGAATRGPAERTRAQAPDADGGGERRASVAAVAATERAVPRASAILELRSDPPGADVLATAA